MSAEGARHPLALRERAWLVAQLRTVRGRTLRPGDQVAVDTAAIVAAGVVLDDEGRVVEGPGVDAGSAESLRAAVAAVERQWRASRREAATEGAPGWATEAARRDEQTVRLLRRVRNAAIRAERRSGQLGALGLSSYDDPHAQRHRDDGHRGGCEKDP